MAKSSRQSRRRTPAEKILRLIKNIIARYFVWLVVLVSLVPLGFGAKWAYQALRDQRIQENLEEARQALRLEDWNQARDKSRSVLIARGNDFEAFRVFSRAMAELEDPMAFMSAISLFANPASTEEDRIWTLRVLATQAPQAVALSAYRSLTDEQRSKGEFRAAMTPLLIARRQVELAESGLIDVLGDNPTPAVRLELIRAICAHPLPTLVKLDTAREQFAALIQRDASKEALEALLLLAGVPDGLSPGKPLPDDLESWVARQPKKRTIHGLVAMQPAISASPANADRIYRDAVERYSAVDPGPLGTWLIAQNRPEMALVMLTEPSKERGDAFIARLHALMKLNRIDEAKDFLSQPPAGADKVEVAIARAIVARREQDQSTLNAAWLEALNEAGLSPKRNRFIDVARAAETSRAVQYYEDAWVGAIRSGWGPLPLYADFSVLIESLKRQGRTEDQLAIARTMLRFESGNPSIIKDYLYLGLLHGIVTPADALSQYADLLAKHPDLNDAIAGLMLAEVMTDRADEALFHLPVLAKATGVAPDVKVLLEGVAHLIKGEEDQARGILSRVNWNNFAPQEQKVFRNLVARQQKIEIRLPDVPSAPPEDPENSPAWRKAIERLERERSQDVLPPLPEPRTHSLEETMQSPRR